MKTFTKQSWETWDYDIEMYDWFNALDDADYMTLIAATCDPAFGVAPALVLGPQSQPDWVLLPDRTGLMRRGKVWIGEGTDGVDYIITLKITTFLGRREETEFKIRVRDTP